MITLDPHRPLTLDTRRLLRRPGVMAQSSFQLAAVGQLGTDIIAVRPAEPMDVDVRLESVLEGILLSGSVRSIATGACVRCLDPVRIEVTTAFQELFVYPDRAAHHVEVVGEEEERVLDGDLLDLEPVLRDSVVPDLPFQPLCSEECPGLCVHCGARLADNPGHYHEVLDPRWEALRAFSVDAGPVELVTSEHVALGHKGPHNTMDQYTGDKKRNMVAVDPAAPDQTARRGRQD